MSPCGFRNGRTRDRRTRLVLILEGIEEAEVRKLWDAFTSDPPRTGHAGSRGPLEQSAQDEGWRASRIAESADWCSINGLPLNRQ